MLKYLRRAYAAFKSWFNLKTDVTKTRKPRAKKKDEFFSHYYLSDLLNKMDRSFKDMHLLKKSDPESYVLFSRVGCSVTSSQVFTSTDKPSWVDFTHLPSFGAATLPIDHGKEGTLYPRFVYFRKIEKPINVQPSNNTVVQVGMIYACPKERFPIHVNYFIAVDQNGEGTLLKELRPETYRVGQEMFTRMVWKKPEMVTDIANEKGRDITEFVTEILYFLLNSAFATESGLTVRVTKQNKTMSFSIDMERTPYFFDKRDKVVNENGNTKRIFHIVRTHKRVAKDGKGKIINAHFRGLRKFTWHGYDVNIILGKKHVNQLSEFGATARQYMPNNVPTNTVDEAYVGTVVGKKLNEA